MSNPLGSTEYDHVILAGQRSPGIARLEGADSPRRLIKRRGFGLSGATVRFAGIELSEFKLQIDLLTSEDWEAWNEWRPLVQRPPAPDVDALRSAITTDALNAVLRRTRAHALDIEHPFLEDLGIRSVLIANVSQPKAIDDKGTYRIEISMCEYRRPVYALSAPAGSSEVAETAEERELRRALAGFDAAAEAAGLAGPPGAV